MSIQSKRLALTASILLSTTAGASSLPRPNLSLPLETTSVKASSTFIGTDGRAGVIIVLAGQPAALAYAQALQGGGGLMATTIAGNASRTAVQQRVSEQNIFMNTLNNSHVSYNEIFRVQRALNGIAVRMAPADMEKVRKLPGVERVEYLPIHTINNVTSVPFVNAPAVWGAQPNLALPYNATGAGIRVGIIDSGIDYQHPAFGGTGVLADYQANDATTIADTIGGTPIFPTAKVVGGFDFAGDAYDASNAPVPDPDPMDCGGHGSHVAGTVAAVGEDNTGASYAGAYYPIPPNYANDDFRIGPGVAPQASLYALRVFGCGGTTDLVTQAIDWAMDPNGDQDLSDRLDVINMSLGSPFGMSFDASAVASDNAAATGMIVVTSAGNSGDTFFITGSPGTGKKVISVANVADAGVPGTLLNVTAPAAITGTYVATAAGYANPVGNPAPPPPKGQTNDVVLVDDGSGTLTDGCQTPFANAAALAGKFALIDRGSCNFTVKAQNAEANGAIGVIIVNNVIGDPVPILMQGTATGAPIAIPGIMISQVVGSQIKAQLAANTVTAVMQAANAGDTLNASSSRGPRGDGDSISLKPDLAAPGTSIPSVQTGITCTAANLGCISPAPSGFIAGGQNLLLSGTSMAAPHVAGLMALLRQLNPTSSVDELKAMAMNTAAHNVSLGANAAPPLFPASRIGAGRVDAARAATAKVLAYNTNDPSAVSVTFDVEPAGVTNALHSVTLKNRTPIPQNVTLSLDTLLDSPGVAFSIPGNTTFTLPASGTVNFNVQMDADTSQMTRFRDPSMSARQSVTAPTSLANFGATPRHFLAEESALLKVSIDASEVARLPIYMAHRPHSDMVAPGNVGFGSSANGAVNLALSGQDVCTGTIDPGPTCNANPAVDHESLVSPFELHVKGAQDNTLSGFANLRYAGVNFDPTSQLFMFGIAAYGKWSTPTDVVFNVCVDADNDGQYDHVIVNTDLGTLSRRLLNASTPSSQDTFINATFDAVAQTVSTGGAARFLNFVSAGQADAALLDNNVMIMGATAAQLGLAAGTTSIKYGIGVCSGTDLFCVFDNLPSNQCTGPNALAHFDGPFSYDAATPAIDTTAGGTIFPIAFEDLNGATIPVTYNTANMVANGSLGMLLLHHHNTHGKTAQVVLIDQIFANGFGGD